MPADPPLTDNERLLIKRTEDTMWTPELREMLRLTVAQRGFRVGTHDTVGDLADFLRAIARTTTGEHTP